MPSTWNMNDVVRIEYRGAYRYFVEFDDGNAGIVDFGPYLDHGPVFRELKDERVFAAAGIQGGTISWPNGADIAPETLYDEVTTHGGENARQTCRQEPR
jgi:hypothetical protein